MLAAVGNCSNTMYTTLINKSSHVEAAVSVDSDGDGIAVYAGSLTVASQ
jgi:hypothetical protein